MRFEARVANCALSPTSSEAIDAPLGTKSYSPRAVPHETKLALTNRASRSSARSGAFGTFKQGSLLFAWSSLFVDHPIFIIAPNEAVRFSDTISLRGLRPPAQLNVGNRLLSKGGTERYKGL
jgi:hypothetical protein